MGTERVALGNFSEFFNDLESRIESIELEIKAPVLEKEEAIGNKGLMGADLLDDYRRHEIERGLDPISDEKLDEYNLILGSDPKRAKKMHRNFSGNDSLSNLFAGELGISSGELGDFYNVLGFAFYQDNELRHNRNPEPVFGKVPILLKKPTEVFLKYSAGDRSYREELLFLGGDDFSEELTEKGEIDYINFEIANRLKLIEGSPCITVEPGIQRTYDPKQLHEDIRMYYEDLKERVSEKIPLGQR